MEVKTWGCADKEKTFTLKSCELKYRGFFFNFEAVGIHLKRDKTKERSTHSSSRQCTINVCNSTSKRHICIALDKDTPNILTQHCQTNGTPYCLGTHRNKFWNQWVKKIGAIFYIMTQLKLLKFFLRLNFFIFLLSYNYYSFFF